MARRRAMDATRRAASSSDMGRAHDLRPSGRRERLMKTTDQEGKRSRLLVDVTRSEPDAVGGHEGCERRRSNDGQPSRYSPDS